MRAHLSRSIAAAMLVGLGLLLGVPVNAQSMLGRVVLASGGGFSSGGSSSIAATIGQPIAGSSDQLLAGFWQTGVTVATDIEDEILDQAIPSEFRLHQNYPNPFNPSTTIAYELAATSIVKVSIMNILGQQVSTLFSGTQAAGQYTITWDARDETGKQMPSGLYLYRIDTEDFSDSRIMVLLK